LVFERRHQQDVVIIAVNRGGAKTLIINGVDFAPGQHTGLLSKTSEANQGNFLTVALDGQATMYLGPLSGLVVGSHPPQP
jgi:hypothetical protein